MRAYAAVYKEKSQAKEKSVDRSEQNSSIVINKKSTPPFTEEASLIQCSISVSKRWD